MKTPANRVFCLSITDRNTGTVAYQSPKRAHLVVLPTQSSYYHHDYSPYSLSFRISMNNLRLLYQDYGAHISVQPSQHEIPPIAYVIDGSELTLDRSVGAGLTRYFPTTELAQIGDETADGIYHPTEFSPLSHFDAPPRRFFPSRGCAIVPVRQLNILQPSRLVYQLHTLCG